MKRFLGAVAGLTLAAAAVAAPAGAQAAGGAVRFGVQGGLNMPMGDLGDLAGMGFTVGALAEVKPVTWPIALRFDAAYHRWGFDDDIADGNLSSIQLTGAAKYMFPSQSTVRPYVLGGLGFYMNDCSEDGCDSETEFGINVGGGLNFSLGTLDTFVETRYHTAGDADFLPIVFGIRF